ncbi:hypothetical protein [Planomonospora parontospora]|uniref:hypothetical protein n=1 Tax=Planomonospora parontospora TaxID=58119 RepID=UPI0016701FE7|nr:hypothetical protein [Planomonospora parontospora]GGL58341.1 hypothetical protein GCM10014719_69670 [Planomonospora parontospora subsp. antibiotica]GII20145.1 hypothetical protein Ppa05_68710 [Planomonospora parontospora subsp. antibiotica]
MNRIDRMVSAIDPAAGSAEPAVSTGVRELLEEIVATPPTERRGLRPPRVRGVRIRRPAAVSAVAALAAAIAIGVGLPSGGVLTRYANAAMSIEKADEHFSVVITDPTAGRRRFEEAFRAVGLDVTVKVIPVAPARVGELFGPIVPGGFKGHGSLGVQRTRPCASVFCGRVWMPADFPGRVVFGVGRAAEPGEPYAEVDFDDPAGAEALSGYTSNGKPVAAVRDELRRRGMRVGYRLLWRYPDGGFTDQPVPADRIRDDWTVTGSRSHSSDAIDLFVVPGPEAGPAPDPPASSSSTPQWYDLTE